MSTIAIITGGNRGLGKSIIDLLLEDGQTTVISLSRSVHEDHEKNNNLVFLKTELANPFEVGVFQIIEKYTHADSKILFFNNASIIEPIRNVGMLTTQEIDRSTDVNVRYPTNFINELIKRYSFHDLDIVNISSGVAKKPLPFWSLYSASKAYMSAFLASLTLENEATGKLNVFDIDPGVIDTGMQEIIRNQHFPLKEYFVSLKDENKLLSPGEAAFKILNSIKFYK